MKSKTLIIFFLLLLSASGYGQTEGRGDSISSNLNARKLEQEGKIESEIGIEEQNRRLVFLRALYFTAPQFYKGPPTEAAPFSVIQPQRRNYEYVSHIPIDEDVSMVTSSTESNYPSLGASRTVGVDVGYQVTDWLSVSGGMYAAKYNMPAYDPQRGAIASHFNAVGFDGAFRLRLSERFYLRGMAGFSVNDNSRSQYLSPIASGNMFPTKYYGGALEFKVNDSFGVAGGMIREYNPRTRKWDNIPYIMPIFYGK